LCNQSLLIRAAQRNSGKFLIWGPYLFPRMLAGGGVKKIFPDISKKKGLKMFSDKHQ
jgi:hypothetical protein